ncbi:hypothetical protein QJS10_CPA02g01041 [Acorus calamus]|uniref:Transcription repressor n=1 Tax=Acorus calamus TaxID=4465 RepID=A0AAV9FCB8_ACOCL|nr:hypothetical protein QJS10_CPA02g01041 [Acorus calamus]
MSLSSLFSYKTTTTTSPPWPWPSCKHPKTSSFRLTDNSAFAAEDPISDEDTTTTTTVTASSEGRLFFDAAGESRSIMEEARPRPPPQVVGGGGGGGGGAASLRESVAVEMESSEPYVDFRASMEEMVEAHGLKGTGPGWRRCFIGI